MKRKLLKSLQVIGITVAVLLIGFLVLRIDAVDDLLTDWIGSPLASETADYRIFIEDFDEPLPDDCAPYVYVEDGKLLLLQGASAQEAVEITPPGVNLEYYVSKHDITAELRLRRHCTVHEDGQQLLFLLENREIPTLFLSDLTTGETVLLATNVDRFLFVGDSVVYATGYDRANQLYVYQDGESVLLADNVHSLALPGWEAVVSLDDQATQLGQEMGKIYRIFQADLQKEEFVVAGGDGIYLLRGHVQPGGQQATSVRLAKFEDHWASYSNNASLIADFIAVYREGDSHFYIQALSDESFILYADKPASWMNHLSSYLYGLSYVALTPGGNAAYTPVTCPVPLSRTLVAPVIAGNQVVYQTAFDQGDIRSVTVLADGKIVKKDVLRTHRDAKGQVTIVTEQIDGKVYFTMTAWGKEPEYSVLSADGTTVYGLRKRVVASFGRAYELD